MPFSPFLFVRGLRHTAHTVFAVNDGQKTYRDPTFGTLQPYASGQQVKRCILESLVTALNAPRASLTFNYQIRYDKRAVKGLDGERFKIDQKEVWSPCDPSYIDQLIGGYMRAEPGHPVVRRRSPLSVSALRPLHPLLGRLDSPESITYDRTDRAAHHQVRVRTEAGEVLSEQAINDLLTPIGRTLPKRIYMPEQTRASGLFVYDICVDLRTLFCVSLETTDPEIKPETQEKLLHEGWTRMTSPFGQALLAPVELRERIIPALAEALLTWRIITNQARTFSLMETLAIAISESADELAGAIRGKLLDGTERVNARPVLDPNTEAHLFTTLAAEGYIAGITGQADALRQAQSWLTERMRAFDYEHQAHSAE